MDRVVSMKPTPKIWMAIAAVMAGLLVPVVAMSVETGMEGSVTGMIPTRANFKVLVIIGASYAGGWPSEQPLAGYRIINKGVSGQQSFEMLARFEADVLALNADAVLIWGFINDVFRSEPTKIDQTLKRTRDSIEAMVELSKKAGVTPILATEVTVRGKDGWRETMEAMIGRLLGKSSYQDYVNGHVIATNRWIRDLAVREKLLLLDLELVLADQHGIRRKEFASPDGSHISPQGYEALMRYSEKMMKASLSSR